MASMTPKTPKSKPAVVNDHSYMDTLMGMLREAQMGSTNPHPGITIDPAAAIRDQNPFASFSNQTAQFGMNPYAKGDQFTDWANKEGFADTQAQYKSAINANPFLRTGQGGDYYSFIGNQGQGMVDTLRSRYASLTPQQRGINSATGYKTGRWAVY